MARWMSPAALVVGAALLAGCQGREVGSGHLIEPGDALHLGYRLGPAVDLAMADDQSLRHAVVLGDMLLTVEAPRNLVIATDLRSATVRWRALVGTPAQRLFCPSRFEDRILINTESELHLLDADTGRVRERQTLLTPVQQAPAMFDSLAIFGSTSGLVFAHNVRTGNAAWRRAMSAQVLATPVVYDTEVFVADIGGRGLMLSALTGSWLWSARTFGRISAAPAVDQVAVYLPCEDQSLYALNRVDGRDRWPAVFRAGVALRRQPRVLGGIVLVNLPGQALQALDAREGRPRWRFDADAEPVCMVGTRLLLHHGLELLAVDPDTGRSSRQVPVEPLHGVLPLDDGQLLLVSPRGRILRLDPIAQGPVS